MIGCGGDSCKREWFHYSCVNLTRKPSGDKEWLYKNKKNVNIMLILFWRNNSVTDIN